jgi:hypothetical protein
LKEKEGQNNEYIGRIKVLEEVKQRLLKEKSDRGETSKNVMVIQEEDPELDRNKPLVKRVFIIFLID